MELLQKLELEQLMKSFYRSKYMNCSYNPPTWEHQPHMAVMKSAIRTADAMVASRL